MSILIDILNLRHNQTSSVELFLAALDWQKAAQDDERILARGYAVTEAADMMLLNVAVHAAEALSEPATIRRTRRAQLQSRRKRRHYDPGELHQRRLFA